MKKSIYLFLVLFVAAISYAQKREAFTLDSIFKALQNENSFNGNVLIADKGKVIFESSYGFANEKNKTKLNIQTKFELASVSKQFTAMAIVMLVKQGKLHYDDQMSKYLPELHFYGNISIQNLLNHTAGLPDYMELLERVWNKSKFVTNKDIVDEFAKHKPEAIFRANERFEYSNTGYALLGLIIEKVSNKSYEDFLKLYIFNPLKMSTTFVYRSRFKPKKVANYAYGYVLDKNGNKVLLDSFGKSYHTYYLDGVVGDGMVNSTIEDLLKWDRALYSNKLVNNEEKKLMFSSFITNDGEDIGYGLGWFVSTTKKYGKIVNHSGGWAGYTTYIERHITNDKTIIILQNNSLPTTKLPIKEIRKILYHEPLFFDKIMELSNDDLAKYEGVFSNEEFPFKITITTKENTLYAQATGQEPMPLKSHKNHTFTFDSAEIKLVFDLDNKTLELAQGELDLIVFKKV